MEEDYEVLKKFFIEKEKENLQLKEELESIKSKNDVCLKSRNNNHNNQETASMNILTTNCQENKLNISEENYEGGLPNHSPDGLEISPLITGRKPSFLHVPNLKSIIFKREKEELKSEKKLQSKSEIIYRNDNTTTPQNECALNMSGNFTENPIVNISNVANTSRSKVL